VETGIQQVEIHLSPQFSKIFYNVGLSRLKSTSHGATSCQVKSRRQCELKLPTNFGQKFEN